MNYEKCDGILREWQVHLKRYNYCNRQWESVALDSFDATELSAEMAPLGPEELGNYPSMNFNKLVSVSGDELLLIAPLSNEMLLASSCYRISISKLTDFITFSKAASLTERRAAFASAVIPSQSKVLVSGGLDNLTHSEVYSVAEDDWELLPPMKTGRYDHACCALSDRFIYAFGGRS